MGYNLDAIRVKLGLMRDKFDLPDGFYGYGQTEKRAKPKRAYRPPRKAGKMSGPSGRVIRKPIPRDN